MKTRERLPKQNDQYTMMANQTIAYYIYASCTLCISRAITISGVVSPVINTGFRYCYTESNDRPPLPAVGIGIRSKSHPGKLRQRRVYKFRLCIMGHLPGT